MLVPRGGGGCEGAGRGGGVSCHPCRVSATKRLDGTMLKYAAIPSFVLSVCIGCAGGGDTPGAVVVAAADARVEPEMAGRASALPGVGQVSTTRIKRIRARGTDGSAMAYGLWDLELQAPCSIGVAADGVLRCQPVDYALSDELFYIDPACTVRALRQPRTPCGSLARLSVPGAVAVDLPFCASDHLSPSPVAVFSVGEEVPLGSPVYEVKPNGDCAQVGEIVSPGHYRLGAEVPSDQFVGYTLEVSEP
jgi:hypothetical protein